MSPAKFHDLEQPRREIQGPRPSPLKLNKDSHIIHKSSSSSSSTNSSTSLFVSGVVPVPVAKKQPVIIYTHSPKIIHTQARDFMALVQKLTGHSRSDNENAPKQAQQNAKTSSLERNNDMKPVGHEDNDSSSVLTEDNCGVGGVRDRVNFSSSLVSPVLNPPSPYFADIPLFTPNSTNFFCSPRPVYRFPDYASPNMSGLTSPSVYEFIKDLPEY